MKKLYNNPTIEEDVEIQDFVIIGKVGNNPAKRRARISRGAKLLTGAIVCDGAEIGQNCLIGEHALIGVNSRVGQGSIVQKGAFIEHDCSIGKFSRIGTGAVLRRDTTIGDYSIFGSMSASEGKNWIGNHVLVHSQCHLTTGIIIEDWVFIAPLFVGANDPDMLHGRRHVKKFIPQAPHIKFGARIAVNVSVLPNVTIGREAFIGATSLVTKDIPDFSVAFGCPARVFKKVESKWRLPDNLFKQFRDRVSEKNIERIKSEFMFV